MGNIPWSDMEPQTIVAALELEVEQKIRYWFRDGLAAALEGTKLNQNPYFGSDQPQAAYWWSQGWAVGNFQNIVNNSINNLSSLNESHRRIEKEQRDICAALGKYKNELLNEESEEG